MANRSPDTWYVSFNCHGGIESTLAGPKTFRSEVEAKKFAEAKLAETQHVTAGTLNPHRPKRTIACGFRGLRPGIPIERDHAVRSKAATCSDEGGRGIVAGMRSWVRFSWLRQDWRAAQ
jgi:hypothetical protein